MKAFEWPFVARITVDGVIAVADAEAVADGRFAPDFAAIERQRLADESIDHDTPLGEVFEDQVACADIVILNKAGLVMPIVWPTRERPYWQKHRAASPCLTLPESRVDPRVVLGNRGCSGETISMRGRAITRIMTTMITMISTPSGDHARRRRRRRKHRGRWKRSRMTTMCCVPRVTLR